jgi:Domain of unknown function (DUF222)
VRYADCRIADEQTDNHASGPGRPKPAEFVADELSLLLRDQPYQVRCLLARSRRMAKDLPTVWEGFRRGDLDADQIRVIDRVARKVTEASTLAAIDDQVIDAAQTKTPKQLQAWLLRLVVRREPLAFAERHRRALTDRRVTVVQGVDGIGYVTGEVSAADAAAIDGMLAGLTRSLGAEDPRTDQQRRADLFADLLLGRLTLDTEDHDHEEEEEEESAAGDADMQWLEVENLDLDTGELLGTRLQRLNPDGEPIGELVDAARHQPLGQRSKLIKRPRTTRIGVVVPLASVLGATDSPAELADRSGFIPGETLRQHITDTIGSDSRDQVLFTRLLTDNHGRLLGHRTRPLCLHPTRRSHQHPRRHLPLPQLHRPRRPLRPRPPPTPPARPNLGEQRRPVLPKTPQRQNLRLARLHPRRPRRRLDHARRRTLPMHRRAVTDRTGGLNRRRGIDGYFRRSAGSPD